MNTEMHDIATYTQTFSNKLLHQVHRLDEAKELKINATIVVNDQWLNINEKIVIA